MALLIPSRLNLTVPSKVRVKGDGTLHLAAQHYADELGRLARSTVGPASVNLRIRCGDSEESIP